MKCYDPKLCYNDGVKKIYRHWSLANPIFREKAQLVFSCGTCGPCRKNNATELAMRCVLHASLYKDNCFLTLTYNEKKDGYHNQLDYTHVQKFKKRLRSYVYRREERKRIQIFNVHEYGSNGKKHWHLVVFNHDFKDKILQPTQKDYPYGTSKQLAELWPFGFNSVGTVTEASAMYQAQYTQKDVKHGNLCSSRKAHSKHAGIGRDYFLNHWRQILDLGYIPFGGRKLPVPRYFEKLAHKHYAYYYEPIYFEQRGDTPARYRKFKPGESNPELADSFLKYKQTKELYAEEQAQKWKEEMREYTYNLKAKPDFVRAYENYKHDQLQKPTKDNF